jgi:signal transduction histidine kinase
MRERAEEIGGTFAIVAVPGSGTTVSVRLPAPVRTMAAVP